MRIMMKRFFAILLLTLIVLPTVGGFAPSAFAAKETKPPETGSSGSGGTTGVAITIPSGDAKYLDTAYKEATTGTTKPFDVTFKPATISYDATKGTGTGTLITNSGGALTLNAQYFNDATDDSKREAMKNFVEMLQGSAVSEQSQQTIMDSMRATNPDVGAMMIPMMMDKTSADIYTAMKWVNPFLPIVRVLFGLGAIVISILLIGSTILDLVFIGLPVAREGMQNKGDKKGGKAPFITMDAISVIKETESALDSSGGYQNAYILYFKRRALTYIVLALCLLYLVVGELGGLIAWLLNLGSGIV